MAKNVTKIGSNNSYDIFTYRDDYNDEQIIEFSKALKMTESEVEYYLNE